LFEQFGHEAWWILIQDRTDQSMEGSWQGMANRESHGCLPEREHID
jgi:hypothetical protein